MFEVDVRDDTEKTQENQVIEAIDESLDSVRADFPGFTLSAKTDEVKQESERSFLWDVGLLLFLGGLSYFRRYLRLLE